MAFHHRCLYGSLVETDGICAPRFIRLREDQAQAVRMGTSPLPLLAIQAAYGTGKTVVGAYIAARLAQPGQLVVATATTNVAVAQFVDTLLAIDGNQHNVTALRFVADSALQEGAPTTAVDLHSILTGLLANYSDSLSPQEQERLQQYIRGRRLIERVLFHPEATLHMTDQEREEYRIAENHNSLATERAVTMMLRVRFPTILCITISSLLNTTKPGGLFHNTLSDCRIIIGDEASQIPEPAFVALTAHFPQARQIYIGDVYQLEPHIRCPRSTLAARLGSKGLMEILLQKDVPLAPLVTTFRAHPALNELPNLLVYGGRLISGTPAAQRTLLINRLSLPNPSLPLVVINVEGSSRLSYTQSHSNQEEADCCVELAQSLLNRDIEPNSIGIITFYKDQQRLLEEPAERMGIRLYTVDSVQGH
ncbi:hypothetical protein V3C99_007774, partial [Haemonchus contortus]